VLPIDFYNTYSPHRGLGNVPLSEKAMSPPGPPPTARQVKCRKFLGGFAQTLLQRRGVNQSLVKLQHASPVTAPRPYAYLFSNELEQPQQTPATSKIRIPELIGGDLHSRLSSTTGAYTSICNARSLFDTYCGRFISARPFLISCIPRKSAFQQNVDPNSQYKIEGRPL
jgi:hypothetical protein